MGLSDWINEDPDRKLSYHTKQQVSIKDKWLGISEKMLQASVLMYVVLFVFIWGEGYFEYEMSRGYVATQVSGDVVAVPSSMRSRLFTADEITHPSLENGNVFVLTHLASEEQKRAVCEDEQLPCESAEDCSKGIGAICSENKLCLEPSWCSVGSDRDKEEIFKLAVANLRIWVKSAISFPRLSKQMFATRMDKPIMFPAEMANTFTLKQILLLCDPPVRFEEISELGAAIEVQVWWDCGINDAMELAVDARPDLKDAYVHTACERRYRARRVDTVFDAEDIGFQYKVARYLGPDHRVQEKRRGIRLFFKSQGQGKKFSMQVVIFKFSTGGSLLVLAQVLTDLLMLKAMRHRQRYHARKYDFSEDFSDAFDEMVPDKSGKGLIASSMENLMDFHSSREDREEEAERERDLEDNQWRRRMEEQD